MSEKHQNLMVGAFCGVVGGVAASGVMDIYWKIVKENFGERPEQKPKGKNDGQEEEQPSTQILADKVSQALTGEDIPKKYKAVAGIGVHYATGLLFGALFGLVAAIRPRLGIIGGLLYGAGIWAVVDEVALRLLDIAPDAEKVPPLEHAQALGAHLVFGSSTAIFTRLLLKLIGGC